MSFLHRFKQINQDELTLSIHSKTATDVENALHSNRPDHEQFLALISPAGEPYLEAMAQKSRLAHPTTVWQYCTTVYSPLLVQQVH